MKNFIALLVVLLAPSVVYGQVQLGGPTYVPSTSTSSLGQANVVMTADANCNILTQTNCTISGGTAGPWYGTLYITSSVALTSARTITVPTGPGRQYIAINKTTGSQNINVAGSTGSPVTISSGSTAIAQWDGTNYVGITGSGSGLPSGSGLVVVASGVGGIGTATDVVNAFNATAGSGTGFLATDGTQHPTVSLGTAGQGVFMNSAGTGYVPGNYSGDLGFSTSTPGQITVNAVGGSTKTGGGTYIPTTGSATSTVSDLLFYATNTGQIADSGISVNPGANGVATYNNSVNSSPTCTTSGGYGYSTPFNLVSYKKVIVNLTGCVNTTGTNQVLTHGLTFTNTPGVTLNTTGLSITVTSTTITFVSSANSTAHTGMIVLEGY